MTTYSASTIAFQFVKKGIEDGLPVSQMKLQKLVYFAHGVNLAVNDTELIKEHFQAWKWGPVVPSIYQTYKLYGSEPISDIVFITMFNPQIEIQTIDEISQNIILDTWIKLKNYDPIALSAWTHVKGSPWEKYYKPGIKEITIPNSEIKDYFKKFLVGQNA